MNDMFLGTKGPMLGVPKITPSFDDSLGGLTGQHSVILRALIYYSEKMQSKVIKGNRCEIQMTPEASFQSPLPENLHTTCLIPPAPSHDNMCQVLPTNKAC